MRQIGLGMLMAAAVVMAQGAALAQPAPKDVTKQAGEAWDTLKSYTVEKKSDAMAMGRKLVRDADREYKKLERAAATASDKAKAQYYKEEKALKASRLEAGRKLDEMGKATGEAWDGTKDAFADAYKELHQGLSRAAAKLKP